MRSLAERPDGVKVIVVDDGSAIVPAIEKTEIIRHDINMGLGKALLTGFMHIIPKAKDKDLLVTMDADDTMDPSVIPDMVAAIERGADLVIASRYVKGARVEGVPLWRRSLSRVASWIARMVIAVPGIRDYSSGFRAYRVNVLREALNLWGTNFLSGSRGFEAQIEILRRMKPIIRCGEEVPIRLDYHQKAGKSHFQFFRTLFGYLREIFLA